MDMKELRDWLVKQPSVSFIDDSAPEFIHFKCSHTEGNVSRKELISKFYDLKNHYIISAGSNSGVKEYKLSTHPDIHF